MSACLSCHRDAGGQGFSFHVLPVRTLHIRDLGGERRVQTLDPFEDHVICEDCARKMLARSRSPLQTARPMLKRFGSIFLIGAGILAADLLLLQGDRVFLLLGLCALGCGVLGCGSALKDSRERSRTLGRMKEEDALAEAAWEAFLEAAPKKSGDEDITWIPVNERTLARKNGDLMILYDLLPEIAVEAWKRIHGETRTDIAGEQPTKA